MTEIGKDRAADRPICFSTRRRELSKNIAFLPRYATVRKHTKRHAVDFPSCKRFDEPERNRPLWRL